MIQRSLYLNKIKAFIDKPLIKVITGIRRCGKSTILLLLKDEIIQRGVEERNILFINFESFKCFDFNVKVFFLFFLRTFSRIVIF